MFYYLSKLFWFGAQPINLIGLLLCASIVLALSGRRRLALLGSCLGFLILAVGAWTSTGALLLHPLEDRFQRPDPAPSSIAGIIVLGGGFEGGVNLVRGGYELNSSGDRFVEAAILARRYLDASVVVTGGSGSLMLEGEGDGETAPRLLTALGVAPARLILETKSRNTHENALFTHEMVKPEPGEIWLLVTSAFHMPRSMGLFQKIGFDVVPWPVDYRTAGNEYFGLAQDNVQDSLQNLTLAIREWIGLYAYWLTGRIGSPLPGPEA
ncbi:YdcF family protein [Aquamicrobium segne]|uniref:YdcF family protein n=1 Tax=Aquamicrobium segne TaxID=469547 RepID=A0ABW0GWF0_9HYPH